MTTRTLADAEAFLDDSATFFADENIESPALNTRNWRKAKLQLLQYVYTVQQNLEHALILDQLAHIESQIANARDNAPTGASHDELDQLYELDQALSRHTD